MRGTKYSITAVAILLCAVMVLVAAAPMTIAAAGDTHTIVKGAQGPRASAVTWVYETGADAGIWTGKIDNNGLRSLVVEVADNTTGIPSEIFSQRIRFAAYDANPIGTVITDGVLMNPMSKYDITAVPNGPRGSSCVVTDQFQVAIAPTASFVIVSNVDGVVTVNGGGSTDDGTIVSYDWEWGDGAVGTGVVATHTYAMTGTYDITLTVTDDMGLTGSQTQPVSVNVPVNVPPNAVFSWTKADLTIAFDASASNDPDGSIVSYAWNFGDGTTGSGMTTSHTYAAGGNFVVVLTVTDNDGATDTDTQTVNPSPPAPTTTMTYTVSNMFELYKKPTDYTKLGRWGSTLGYNSWMDLRKPNYAEWMVTTTYPFVMTYNPYSTVTSPVVNMGNQICSWYRLGAQVVNAPGAATGPGKDPIFVPVMGNMANNGGTITANWYSTYLTTQEMIDIRAGIHYANTYYGVPIRVTPLSSQDDGYWHEFQGTMSFSREAAQKCLGLPGTGDLEDEFTANMDLITGMWFDDWMAEGSGGGAYDIYTAYDYPNDMRYVSIILDPTMANTNPDTLYLRIWAVSWGIDVLLWRYIEASGVLKSWQGWADDWYLNLTIRPDSFDLTMRGVIGYQLAATTDQGGYTGAAWSLEAMHLDWAGNTATHSSYVSPFNPYDPDQYPAVLKMNYAPGTVNYGVGCSYAVAPTEMDLVNGEKWIIKLSTYGSIIGYIPYKATTDTLNDAKIAEYGAHDVTGTLTIGTGWPTTLGSYYNSATKTLTLIGPMDFPRAVHPDFPALLAQGTPTIMFNVV